jgi:energy-coupling factor transporter ATP-binding protein EcfA2
MKDIYQAWADAFRPPADIPPWAWGAKYVRIANSERSAFFDPEQTPWWKAPMECAADVETRQVVVLAPTGSGKSTMAEALACWIISESPGGMLYASQTDATSSFWAESRLMPAIRQCDPLKNILPQDRNKFRKTEIIFPHMPLVVTGANMSSFQELSMQWLYGDEVWAWKQGLIREFQARHHNRWNRKEYLVSQGGFSDGEFDTQWQATNKARFSWRCECGSCQPFDWKDLKFDTIEKNGVVDKDASANTARMICPKCGKEHADEIQNRRMLAASNMDNGEQGYIATREAPEERRGFQVDRLAIWWIPWKLDVLSFLTAMQAKEMGDYLPLQQWRQKHRADFWSEDQTDSPIELGGSSGYCMSDCATRERLPGEIMMRHKGREIGLARFMAIDAGKDHFWFVVATWKPGGVMQVLREGRTQSRGIINGVAEPDLVAIQEEYGIAPHRVWLDFGFEIDRMSEIAATNGWQGVLGRDERSFRWGIGRGRYVERLFSERANRVLPNGKVASYRRLASNRVKDILHRMTQREGAIELPDDVSDAFREHMQCERREKRKLGKDQGEEWVWVAPKSHAQNHLWDCMYYLIGQGLIYRLFSYEDDAPADS